MKIRLMNLWQRLIGSFWFMPLLMTLIAIGLAFAMIVVDEHIRYKDIRGYWWIFAGGVNGARSVLSAISGSMISVTSITFSLTMVVLSLTSGQFGPRLLRNFIYDIRTQSALGVFIATYVYCLVVLRTVRGVDEQEFIPYVAVTVGVALSILSIGTLIFFIHHVALSIQAPKVIGSAYRELEATIDRIFPEKIGKDDKAVKERKGEEDLPDDFDLLARAIPAPMSGYAQTVDSGAILRIAIEHKVLLRLAVRPGGYVTSGQPLAHVCPPEQVNADLAAQLHKAFSIGDQRTPVQDVGFGFSQLTEIALFALSSGINDPHTALSSIDRLGSGLCHLAERVMPNAYRYDEFDVLRVIAQPLTFSEIIDLSLGQIRQHGANNGQVLVRLLKTIGTVAACIHREEDRSALLEEAKAIRETSRTTLPQEQDQKQIEAAYREAMRALHEGASVTQSE